MKKFASVFLIVILACTLSACSGGISGDEAKSFVNDFFYKIEAKDYEAAKGFLHPDRPADVELFFEGIEEDQNVDFSDIHIERYTGIKTSFYDSSVNGSTYTLEMDISLSGREAEVEIEIVKNDKGYGIYNFDFDIV